MTAHMGKAASKAISNFQIAVNRILLTPIPWRRAMSMRRVDALNCVSDSLEDRQITSLLALPSSLQHVSSDTPIVPCAGIALTAVARPTFPSKGTVCRQLRKPRSPISRTSAQPQLQFTPSFASAATPCELHPTSAHPPHSTSHHRECCPPVRLTLCIPERMVHA